MAVKILNFISLGGDCTVHHDVILLIDFLPGKYICCGDQGWGWGKRLGLELRVLVGGGGRRKTGKTPSWMLLCCCPKARRARVRVAHIYLLILVRPLFVVVPPRVPPLFVVGRGGSGW